MTDALVKATPPLTVEMARARIEAARSKVTVAAAALKEDLSPYDFRGSIRNKPWNWILGGLAVGFLVGSLLGGNDER